MPNQTDEQLEQADRMLRDAVAALDSVDSQLLEAELTPFALPNWSDEPVLPNTPTSVATNATTPSTQTPITDLHPVHTNEELRIELGHTSIALKDLYNLSENAILLLNVSEHEPVDLLVGDAQIAKGEILCMDGRICFRVLQLIEQRSTTE